MSRDYHGGSTVFSGENLAHKSSRIRSSEASNFFFYKIQETKINSSTDRHLLNMRGIQNKHSIKISKEFWGNSEQSNIPKDWASRNFQDSSEWKLYPTAFRKICSHLGKPLLDLFVSWLCYQLPQYIAWRPDLQIIATDAFNRIGNTN